MRVMSVKDTDAIREAAQRAQALSMAVREVEAAFHDPDSDQERTTLLRVVSRDGSTVVYSEVPVGETHALRSRTEDQPRALYDLAQETGVPESALLTFAHTLGALIGAGREISEDAVRRAALLSVASMVWEDELGPLLTSAEAARLIGGVTRQRVSELLGAHRLIGLRDQNGRLHFPAFQFQDGKPLPALVDAFWRVAEHVGDWTAASWCVSSDQDALDGESPAQWVKSGRDPERLARVTRQDAARFAA
jgi:hypothetical protein